MGDDEVMTHDRTGLSAALSLEKTLGDPLDGRSAGSFATAVAADRAERFPEELCAAALDWGLADHLIPEAQGGRLRSIEECLMLSRVLARRDPTAAVAVGANLLASLPVWLRGSDGQRELVARLLRERRYLSFALSEREHGADVLASDVSARPEGAGWRIDGTKWLINNAGHASAATVAARTGDGVRGLTLFLTRREGTAPGQWTPLPKIPTHGLRGSAFGGLALSGLPVGADDVVGRKGQGLLTLLETLQITRVLVAGFALGALDTGLRATVAFAAGRRLYGAPIAELESVAGVLVDAYTDLLIGETLALGACRSAHLAPEQLPLLSASVKYLVPRLAAESLEALCGVLGARSYLAGEHWYGIVEKLRRDCAVTSLFDGSAPVNLGAIADQLPELVSARLTNPRPSADPGLFGATTGTATLPWLDEIEFELATGEDRIITGITAVREELRVSPGGYHRELPVLLDLFAAAVAGTDVEVTRHAGDPERHRSGATYDLAARYTALQAGGACAWTWLNRRGGTADPFTADGSWLVLRLRRLARVAGLQPARDGLGEVERAALARLQHAYDERYLFSDFEFPLA